MAETKLDSISPDVVERNPDNPRLIFRQDELEVLLSSIKKVGIQVPLSVYKDDKKDKYILIDGERRWLCSKKLNLKYIPVIIEPKPSHLENLLRMFNIHNVRVQWDLYAIALKLEEIKSLLYKKGNPSTDKDLAAITGVSLTTVKRAFDLLKLPRKYLNILEKELRKPKSEQIFSEDFFIEMMKALKAIQSHTPQILERTSEDKIIKSFMQKYEKGIIKNMVSFRDLSKIARSEKAGVSKNRAIPIINKLIEDPNYTINQAYNESVASAYAERTLKKDIENLIDKLKGIKESPLEPDVKKLLKKLFDILKNFFN